MIQLLLRERHHEHLRWKRFGRPEEPIVDVTERQIACSGESHEARTAEYADDEEK